MFMLNRLPEMYLCKMEQCPATCTYKLTAPGMGGGRKEEEGERTA